jgi:hypothetical protein
MLETLFLAALIYLFLTHTKKKRKPRTLDEKSAGNLAQVFVGGN